MKNAAVFTLLSAAAVGRHASAVEEPASLMDNQHMVEGGDAAQRNQATFWLKNTVDSFVKQMPASPIDDNDVTVGFFMLKAASTRGVTVDRCIGAKRNDKKDKTAEVYLYDPLGPEVCNSGDLWLKLKDRKDKGIVSFMHIGLSMWLRCVIAADVNLDVVVGSRISYGGCFATRRVNIDYMDGYQFRALDTNDNKAFTPIGFNVPQNNEHNIVPNIVTLILASDADGTGLLLRRRNPTMPYELRVWDDTGYSCNAKNIQCATYFDNARYIACDQKECDTVKCCQDSWPAREAFADANQLTE